jgi:hypothetical protein
MAPLPDIQPFKSYLSTLFKRTPTQTSSSTLSLRDLSPKDAGLVARAKELLPRSTGLSNPGAGVTPPQNVPNKVIFILFGLIGVGFIVTGIWFFFWAKNGGFYFHKNDWDDYKTTVLRRKGPNGTTLSGATATTDLGGGSIVHGEKNSKWRRLTKGRNGSGGGTRYKDFDEEGTLAGSGGGSALGSEMGEIKYKALGGKKIRKGKNKDARPENTEFEPRNGDNHTQDNVHEELRAYRHEKVARVGGLNKESDASVFDSSTADNSTAASDLLSHREQTPTNTPTKSRKERNDNYTGGTGGIRKVESTSSPGTSFWNRATGSSKKKKEEERIQAEARKLQEKGRAARRDFSFQAGDDVSSSGVGGDEEEARARREARREARRGSRSPTKKVPGSYYEESVVGSDLSGDIGTKSYHHPIPGLSGSEYTEERRKRRNETRYRRDEF